MTTAPEAERLSYGEPAGRWVLAATVLGSSVAFLDATVVNIALPAIGTELDADAAALTWVVNGYTLTLAAFVLVGGSLGDRYGRRRVFLVGAAWFGLASLACALATTTGMLVVFRALQGVGAALLTPGSLAILQSAFRSEDRSRAIGAWSGLAGIAGAVGPFLGGLLVDAGSWRWIFFLNVPVLLAVLVIAVRHVPESREESDGGLDLGGAALAALGLGALTYGLSAWSTAGPGSVEVQLGLGLGLTGVVGFLVRERSTVAPMLPLGIFAAPRFAATNAVTFLVYAGLGGVFFWLVVTLQVVSGWDALTAGLALIPITALMLLFSPRAGALGDRLGARAVLTAGPLVAASGVALLSRVGPGASYFPDVVVPVALLGTGLTITVAPLTTTVLGAVGEGQVGLASGTNNAVARTGGLVAVAMLPAVTGLGDGGFSDPQALEPAFEHAMLVCAALFALAGAVAAVSLRPVPGPGPSAESPRCAPRHCAVDATPMGVAEGTGRR